MLNNIGGCTRVVCVGATDNLDSFRHIWRSFTSNARKLGLDAAWLSDKDPSAIRSGDLVMVVDLYAENIPVVSGAKYVMHNVSGDHRLFQEFADDQFIRLQVWTTDATGDEWDRCRQFEPQGRVLFQPWGSDLLAEEFLDPVFSGDSRNVTFVGAVWADQYEGTELGNKDVIREVRDACAEYGLTFRHLTQISDREQVEATREARLSPTFVGGWQAAHGYLPCRAFKLPSYGALMFTNSDMVNHLFGDATVGGYTVSETLGNALSLRRFEYLDMVREQQRIASRYTFRESLQSIDRALREIA